MVVPSAMLGFVGVTWIEDSVTEAGATVSVVLPDLPLKEAVIVAVPAPTGVASPLEPCALLIVAIAFDEEPQVTDAVRSWLVLSE